MNAPLLDRMKDTSGYDRTFKRYRISFPMSIQTTEDEDAGQEIGSEILPGLAHNISLSGIGFVCSGRFDLHSLLEIEIILGSQTFSLLASVRWCQPLTIPGPGDALYHYGAQFVRTETVLEFIPVAAEFLLAQGSERLVRCEVGRIPIRTPGTVPIG